MCVCVRGWVRACVRARACTFYYWLFPTCVLPLADLIKADSTHCSQGVAVVVAATVVADEGFCPTYSSLLF